MRKSHCLVTGGSGFIESNFFEYFIAEGHSVTAMDELSTIHIANVVAEIDLIE